MAEWSNTTTDEQRFYQYHGFIANRISLDLFWDKYFKCLSRLDDDNTVGALREEVKRDKHFWAHKARKLDELINRYDDTPRPIRSTLCPSTYEIYCYGGERTLRDPT